jgi:hypothetical protein
VQQSLQRTRVGWRRTPVTGDEIHVGTSRTQRIGQQFAPTVAAQDQHPLACHALRLQFRKFEHGFGIETLARSERILDAMSGKQIDGTLADGDRLQSRVAIDGRRVWPAR